MPFAAELRVQEASPALLLLRQSVGLSEPLRTATSWEGELRIDILTLLLSRDLYGRTHDHAPTDQQIWSAARLPVLTEPELLSEEVIGFIGEWNLPLLRWMKWIAIQVGETLSIQYSHERGDTLYEVVDWSVSPSAETFHLRSYEGMEELEWEKEVVRYANRAGSESDASPRTLGLGRLLPSERRSPSNTIGP